MTRDETPCVCECVGGRGEPASTSEPNLSPHMATQARLINAPRRRPSPYHAHGTHTRHERSRSMQQKERAKITPLPATAAVSVAICRQADRLRRARGSLVLVGWLHQSCIIAASRMLGSHGATPRWPDRSGRRARPGLARTPAAGSGSSGERPRRTRTPHRRTWCSQRCSPRP